MPKGLAPIWNQCNYSGKRSVPSSSEKMSTDKEKYTFFSFSYENKAKLFLKSLLQQNSIKVTVFTERQIYLFLIR